MDENSLQGALFKLSTRGWLWNKRYVFVKNGKLCWYNKKPVDKTKSSPKRLFSLQNAIVERAPLSIIQKHKKNWSFQVVVPNFEHMETVYFACESEEELDNWIINLSKVVQGLKANAKQAGKSGQDAVPPASPTTVSLYPAVGDKPAIVVSLSPEKQRSEDNVNDWDTRRKSNNGAEATLSVDPALKKKVKASRRLSTISIGDIDDFEVASPRSPIHAHAYLSQGLDDEEAVLRGYDGTGKDGRPSATRKFRFSLGRPSDTPLLTQEALAAHTESNNSSAKGQWNDRFQKLLDVPVTTFEESIQRGLKLSELIGQFVAAASRNAETIIDEYTLPLNKKTIRHVNRDETQDSSEQVPLYEADDMLLLIAEDPVLASGELEKQRDRGLAVGSSRNRNAVIYSDDSADSHGFDADERQARMSGLELRGCVALAKAASALCPVNDHTDVDSNNGVPPIRLNLITVVDYKGFRVHAVSVVHLNGTSTVVHGYVPTFQQFAYHQYTEEILSEMGVFLNIKPHELVYRGMDERVRVMLSSDLEAHHDNHYIYLIHCSRIYPADIRGDEPDVVSFVPRQLRPELVQAHSTRISAGALRDSTTEVSELVYQYSDKQEAQRASEFMRQDVVRLVVQKLDSLELLPYDSETLTRVLHSHGVNVHYLGSVSQLTRMPHIRNLCVTEMLARICKKIFRRLIREKIRMAKHRDVKNAAEVDKDIYVCVVDFFNLVLGSSIDSERFWGTVLLPKVSTHFEIPLEEIERSREDGSVVLSGLFLAMQFHCGVKFEDQDIYSFQQMFDDHHSDQNPAHQVVAITQLRAVESKKKFTDMHHLECHLFADRAVYYRDRGELELAMQAVDLKRRLKSALRNGEDDPTVMAESAEILLKAGDIDGAMRIVQSTLMQGRTFHALSARVYMVLMRICFMTIRQQMVPPPEPFVEGEYNFELLGQETITCYENAVRAIEYQLGTSHPMLLEVHEALAKICSESGLHHEALKMYNVNVALAQRVLGLNHPSTAVYHIKAGHVHRALRNADAAIQSYEKALLIHETALGRDSPVTASSCFFLCEALSSKGDYNQALEYGIRALHIRESVFGYHHLSCLNSYYQVAVVAEKAGREDNAIQYYEVLLGELRGAQISDEQTISDIQSIVRAIIKIKLKNLTVPQRVALKLGLEKLPEEMAFGSGFNSSVNVSMASATHNHTWAHSYPSRKRNSIEMAEDPEVAATVAKKIYESASPSQYMNLLVEQITDKVVNARNRACLELLAVVRLVERESCLDNRETNGDLNEGLMRQLFANMDLGMSHAL
eukprot:GILJ01008667.1.p1 GENE.GILJ01008667.1~~GILJ01008667.1.p1  ORF type:complete len:1294 (-),score=234.16 GILJ01008667.1:164-4045(-)